MLPISYKIQLSDSELAELLRIKKEVTDSKLLRRYQCLHMLHKGMKRHDIAELLDVYIDTVTDWIKIYLSEGLQAMGELKYEGRRQSALDNHKAAIKEHIETSSINTVAQLQEYIKTSFGIGIEHSWISRYLKKNCIALIKKPG